MLAIKLLVLTFILISNISVADAGVVTQVQHVNGGNDFGGTSYARAFTNDVHVGDIGVVVIMWESPTIEVTTVTGSRCAYTLLPSTLAQNASGNDSTQFAYCIFTSSGPETVTVHWGSSTSGFVSVYELTAGSLDQVAANTGSSNTPGSTNTVTTTGNGDYGIAMVMENGNGATGTFTVGSGWVNTGLDQNIGGGGNQQGVESTTQTSAGSLTGNFTGENSKWASSLITFKPPVSNNIIQGSSIVSGNSIID